MPELVKCEELWYDDGNLVIQAEDTLFKVHRGILCDNSSVFRDMFKLPQSPSSSEKYEGDPMVRLYDSAKEMIQFLLALFKSRTFYSPLKPTFSQAVACARLGTKYDVPHVRLFGLKLLRRALPLSFYMFKFPLDPDDLPFIPPRSSAPTLTIAFDIINLARQLDIPDLLPAAYATVSSMSIETITSGLRDGNNTARLDDQDVVLCLKARESFVLASTRIMVHIANVRCMEGCDGQFDKMYNDLLRKAQTPFLCNPMTEGLCRDCGDGLKMKIRQIRQVCWDGIPDVFGLPCWEVLQARRGEDEMHVPR